jgi:geranylgeranyl diphosphate synthase, type I
MASKAKAKKQGSNIFLAKLNAYKSQIDEDIADYSKHVRVITLQQYGANARLESDAFLGILSRGGKRIRGALTMLGYEMSGGQNRAMILQVARAIEMLHAYILIIDDIQDRSSVRRGGPSAHIMLADHHRHNHLAGDSGHFGMSLALNAALAGAHAAQMIMANIDAPEQLRLNALSIINRTMVITAHGQTSDIMNESVAKVGMDSVDKVLVWKTAQYSFLNPLHVGMVLAGADCHATDAITGYAMNIGKAYQITDDILGTFGSEQNVGKSPMDDLCEGKRTILTVFALENTPSADKNFLLQMLGNQELSPAEFERCKDILVSCGALNNAKNAAKTYTELATSSLDAHASRWTPESTQFLHSLADYIQTRTA